jgi:glycosyltransferase involved in cell wall biosynthesis
MNRRLKVLASAYACEPDKGSEPGIGWNWVKQIARFHEVWVITRENNKEAIESTLAKSPISNVHWVYFDLPRWLRFWKKGQPGIQLYYYLWQIGAYFICKRLHNRIGFDLVHHLTFVKYWMPSFLAFLPLPFIWGPVGGGDSTPSPFFKTFSIRGKLYEHLRHGVRWLFENDPFVNLTAKRAQVVVATTPETKKRLEVLGCRHIKVFPAVGISERETEVEERCKNHIFRIVSVGNLLHLKGFQLGLMAFARFQQEFPNCEYHIIGDGPERANFERLAKRYRTADKVRFWGHLPRQQVLEKLSACDVLVHPTLHDSGGWVSLEAMSVGLPVICLDLGGPALQVTEETGFKVPAISPEQVVSDLADALHRLVKDVSLRIRMGQAARERLMQYFDWNRKGEWIRETYEHVAVCEMVKQS